MYVYCLFPRIFRLWFLFFLLVIFLNVFQAQTERKREQEAQLLEKQRLEEILTMCAEYERQAQHERQTKPPTTPTLQQNRLVSMEGYQTDVVY